LTTTTCMFKQHVCFVLVKFAKEDDIIRVCLFRA
jgi:hypothetical protein